MIDKPAVTRRIALVSIGSGAVGIGGAAMAQDSGRPPVDLGTVQNGKVLFPPSAARSEAQASPPRNADAPGDRVGFAIVGLGKLALEEVMPAFAQAKYAKPVALVSGSPDKMQAIAAQYGIAADACYGYADMARLRDNHAVQVVYVITPNALHRQHVIAAARAGKHVLCEKPMANSLADCHAMIEACRDAQVKLMIAYRMQYQPHAREAIRLARSGALGAVTMMDMVNNQNQGDPAQWRQVKALAGGGSLPDVGLYCLNTARAVLGEEPIAINAQIWSPQGDPRFREVEDNVAFSLHFPSGAIANCMSSYGTHRLARMTLIGSDAWAEMAHAFDYQGQNVRVSRLTDGKEQTAEIGIEAKNQFALELDHMAQCVRQNITPRTPGEEGAQDQRIIEAIYEAARTGQRIRLPQMPGIDRFRGPEPVDA